LVAGAALLAAPSAQAAYGDPVQVEGVSLAAGGTITVTVTGIRSNDGKIMLAMWDQSAGFPTKSRKAMRVHYGTISAKKSTIRLVGYAPGTYAISVFHDENSNGELDTNFIGMPKEGVGASNNPKARMGPPKFKDAKFELAADDLGKPIKLAYL
jgi:uncharacterized protein (DUF2141 family)